MKYLSEYRDRELVETYLSQLKKITTRPWTLMEICGGQTHGLVKNGILDLLPDSIRMVHGPGCPVCVTPLSLIDKAIYLAAQKEVILCTYGDMLRVPGSHRSLQELRARGSDIRILYSPLEAVEIAIKNTSREVVFFAVGFETTAPANALSVLHAHRLGLKNYSILTSQVLVPPAMEAILQDENNVVQGFLAAGHVCTIVGMDEYYPLVNKYRIPIVVTGFEPVDLLQGILMVVSQLEKGEHRLENQYSRVVRPHGNPHAQEVIGEIFEVSDRQWRGIGTIPSSGYELKQSYHRYDANRKFSVPTPEVRESPDCIAGEILRGIKKPFQCPVFGKGCTPLNPLGAPMVSSEGTCAAYYQFSNQGTTVSSS
ncbi:MAG: hydrogenase formation protein HypD [Bacteroidota bacterium]|nr:hydrogenase formation protein HypD [Bacteroidota bacterium]